MKEKKEKNKIEKESKSKKILNIFFNKKVFLFFLKWGSVFFIWFLVIFLIILSYYSKDIPDITEKINPSEINLQLLYSNQNELYKYGNINSNIENYAEFPLYLIDGLIATEDRKFFKHHGFDYLGILRAMLVNIRYHSIRQGGSTITQQLSKMLLKNSKKTFKRKIQELLLSMELEKKLSKEKIITMYLNNAYFGSGKYGIKDASKFYFNKKVPYLNLEESAMLIGLLKAPSKYSPQNNFNLSKERTKQIITNMYNAKLLSKKEYEKYLDSYYLSILETRENLKENLNQKMYFADYIKTQINDWTDKKNIEITTTLNENIQNSLEKTIYDFKTKYSNKLKDSQIAVVILGKDGAILGMTGGIDYNKSEFNRAIYGYRQAGSAFKLFVFLNGIIEKNYNLNTYFIDEPVSVGNWFPENYNEKYYGKITMKNAFAKSSNSVSIQIAEWSGLKKVAKLAKKMGIISKIDKDDPTIALGTTQVNLLELTSAYSVITNDGFAIIPYSITKIKDKDTNNIIYNRKKNNNIKILNEYEIDSIRQMLYEVINSKNKKNAKINYLMNKGYNYIGGKTGTSQNYYDAWFIGYANDITVGVWIGNDNNKKNKNKMTGGELPAMLWKDIVKNIVKE